MSTTVPREFEQFVAQAIASGRFRSEEEAAAEAFDLLWRREQKLDALRTDIQVGLDDISAGRVTPLDLNDMKRRGYERLAAEKSRNTYREADASRSPI
ncbi:MAG: type II toxin-antitoxin system ParD family antitoxin [Planctomycetaceae bacterium]